MKDKLFAGAVVAALIGTSAAVAADFPAARSYAAPPPPPPSYSWTGCYVGIQGGGDGGVSTFSGSYNIGAGFLAGGFVGCNYQIDHFVFSIEGDGLWSGLNIDNSSAAAGTSVVNTTKNKWDADVALRAGLAFDRFLIYSKTGIAFGRFDFQSTTTGAPFASMVTTGGATVPGFLQGLGLEYMITPQLTARAEVDMTVFDAREVTFTCAPVVACPAGTVSSSQNLFLLGGKVGLAYKF